MHSHGISHLDLSLENTMIASVDANHIHVKIIDFGLARRVKSDQMFHDRVGKIGYMAPEVCMQCPYLFFFLYVYARKEYSPEKADIWCLGVMLFMMLVGAPPYQVPDPSNPAFRFLVNGRLRDVLVHWKRLPLIPADALDVMSKIFKPESQRISMKDLRLHKFVGLSDKTTTDDKADALNLSSPLVAQDKNR
ncbi:ser/thr protein kinase [Reticulomyxa filosa]|uniref:Ser/thr protein kinase n=1 Tax=Reticulomyxa filosa TaxID=46433 RepID=X6PA44_RETFI|nr:ser/thr protein kinase [Reticulomyxa filosa]|eukprot:ETO34522.1 ser/thr protein kinase [Reticulomyxa filosa]